MTSYSGYLEFIENWWTTNVDKDWSILRNQVYEILQREDTLKEIVRLLGPEALPDEEKLILDVARMEKIGFLQQNSFDKIDTYTSPEKQVKLLRIFVTFYKEALNSIRNGVSINDIRSMKIISQILRAKFEIKNNELDKLNKLENQITQDFKNLTTINKESEGN
jgi:V/A-type H+-transporting ATPase subunit A